MLARPPPPPGHAPRGGPPRGRHPGERLVSSGWQKADHNDEDAATTCTAQLLQIAPHWWRNTTTAPPAWRLPLPARICPKPPAQAWPRSLSGLPRKFVRGLSGDLWQARSEEHTSELQSRGHLVCRLLLEKKKKQPYGTAPQNTCDARVKQQR